VLERLHHERAHVIGARPVAPAQVGKLDYLDAVVKETLQLNPIVSDVGRVLASPMRRCVLPSVSRTERSPLRIVPAVEALTQVSIMILDGAALRTLWPAVRGFLERWCRMPPDPRCPAQVPAW
jgi:hypothetical protein